MDMKVGFLSKDGKIHDNFSMRKVPYWNLVLNSV